MPYRKIIHIDMDAFFVSVEEHDNPALKGHPVVVGYDGPRGVVATANYIARKYGIHSALPVATAHRLCPDLIVVEGRYERYKEISRQVHSIFHEYTDIIEPLSLDEAYLDVTANKKGMTLAVDIAREIKQRILEETGLTASAGVSYCKFLAKIASDYRKPNGLCTVHPDRALDFIDGLKVEQLWGVGEKTAQRMHTLGVFTGKELRDVPLATLTRVFGKMGRVFHDFARGIDHRPVVTEWVRKSVGCERTFAEDLTTYEDMSVALTPLASELVRRLEKNNFKGRSLVLKVKYSDFRQTTHSFT
ncbi:MAG: DNA polymerase IV, partial [Paludibacteraceae bacterium]|nr:DNA polymerase IV [Paludibacteraceae bacterium]